MTFVKTPSSATKPRRSYLEQEAFIEKKRKGEKRKNLMRNRRDNTDSLNECCDHCE